MKILLKMFERMRPAFGGDGKLRAAAPLFDAIENFFFSPATRTETAPHVRDPLDVKRFMSMVIVALLPCVAMAIYYFGLRVLAMIVVSYAAGGAVEVLFAIVRKEEINEGFLVTGLLFPLVLPPLTPLWIVAVGVAFGVLVGKEVFGGTGRNLFNPALVGRCFVMIAYAPTLAASRAVPIAKFPECLWTYLTPASEQAVDAVSKASPLGAAKTGSLAETGDLFFGNVTGCIGETSALAILIGAAILLVVGVASWRSMAATLGSFLLLSGVLHWMDPAAYAGAGWHVLAGGILFGGVFMVTDPVSSPSTKTAKWAYGIIIGVVTVLIRNFTGYVEGVTFAILLGNIVAPILDEIVIAVHVRRLPRER